MVESMCYDVTCDYFLSFNLQFIDSHILLINLYCYNQWSIPPLSKQASIALIFLLLIHHHCPFYCREIRWGQIMKNSRNWRIWCFPRIPFTSPHLLPQTRSHNRASKWTVVCCSFISTFHTHNAVQQCAVNNTSCTIHMIDKSPLSNR